MTVIRASQAELVVTSRRYTSPSVSRSRSCRLGPDGRGDRLQLGQHREHPLQKAVDGTRSRSPDDAVSQARSISAAAILSRQYGCDPAHRSSAIDRARRRRDHTDGDRHLPHRAVQRARSLELPGRRASAGALGTKKRRSRCARQYRSMAWSGKMVRVEEKAVQDLLDQLRTSAQGPDSVRWRSSRSIPRCAWIRPARISGDGSSLTPSGEKTNWIGCIGSRQNYDSRRAAGQR